MRYVHGCGIDRVLLDSFSSSEYGDFAKIAYGRCRFVRKWWRSRFRKWWRSRFRYRASRSPFDPRNTHDKEGNQGHGATAKRERGERVFGRKALVCCQTKAADAQESER